MSEQDRPAEFKAREVEQIEESLSEPYPPPPPAEMLWLAGSVLCLGAVTAFGLWGRIAWPWRVVIIVAGVFLLLSLLASLVRCLRKGQG